MTHPQKIHLRMLAIVMGVVVITALRLGYPVAMPLIAACFIIATAWPIKTWLDARLPTALSYIGTIVTLVVLFLGFFALVYYAVAQVALQLYDHQAAFRDLYMRYNDWAKSNGLPPIVGQNGSGGFDRIVAVGRSLLADVYTLLSYLGLITVIVIMGLPEVPAMVYKFRQRFGRKLNRELYETTIGISNQFRSYLVMTALTSLITGVASTLFSLAVGLDMALIWGILNFLLNFIPVLGNVLGILPPALYAIIQYGGWVMPSVVLIGFAILQILISNFVYPMLQGRGVAMPPVTITAALLFWGWLWGLAGALLAVPLTAGLIAIARQFESTEALAYLLTRDKAELHEDE